MAGYTLLMEEHYQAGDERFLAELLGATADKRLQAFGKRWYEDARPFARRMLLAYVDDGCDRPHHRALVKRLFKLAEAAGDDEAMGRFLVACDRLRARVLVQLRRFDWRTRVETSEWVLRSRRLRRRPFVNPNTGEKIAIAGPAPDQFSTRTRGYLQRRAWRYFRRLAFRDPARYRRALFAALALYRDDHLRTPEQLLDSWGLVHALYWGAPQLDRSPWGIKLTPGAALDALTPAPLCAAAWRGVADELFALLAAAQCRTVRQFVLAWLQAEYARELDGLPLARLRPLLASPYEEVQLFAVQRLEMAPGLAELPLATWLELLALPSLLALPVVCRLVGRNVAPLRLSLADCVTLACARPAPVAELGWQWLRARALPTVVELAAALPVADAVVPRVRAEAAAWLVEQILAVGQVTHLRELVDARHADVRAAALARLEGSRFADASELWVALIESPYDDVRAHLVAHLDARARGFQPDSLMHLWATTLLSVHRGGRAKPLVVRQIAARIGKVPAEAEPLLGLLAIALRSLRTTERAAALAAVVRALVDSPAAAAAAARKLPELKLLHP